MTNALFFIAVGIGIHYLYVNDDKRKQLIEKIKEGYKLAKTKLES